MKILIELQIYDDLYIAYCIKNQDIGKYLFYVDKHFKANNQPGSISRLFYSKKETSTNEMRKKAIQIISKDLN